jgi:hypothetical protein
MTRHYSTRDFFRQMPNALLARYFSAREVLQEFDFEAMKESKIDALFDAWMELPEAARVRMESELREICDMACAVGTQAILDEAEFHLDDDRLANFRDRLMALPGHYERAMTVFLDHANLWRGATRFHHADTLSYWRKRKNLPRVAAAADPASLRSLEAAIRCYYRVSEGRGRHCRVEPYRRGDRDYFFAFPEDYAQQSVEWEGDDFSVRPHHPAFEVVFVYRRSEGTLDLYVARQPEGGGAICKESSRSTSSSARTCRLTLPTRACTTSARFGGGNSPFRGHRRAASNRLPSAVCA